MIAGASAPVRPRLDVRGIEVVYNRAAIAIQGVSFKVEGGQLVALLGTNGAGKTTTLRAVAGFLGSDDARITQGTVEYGGDTLSGKTPYEIVRRGIALVPEREKVFETLTVQENLDASVFVRRDPRLHRGEILERVFHYFPILAQRRRQIAGYLSGGERQMLAIGEALLCAPELLLVDELSLGLAPRLVIELMEILRRLRDEMGLTVVLVEQNAAAALRIADHAYVMEHGRIVYEGTATRLMEHEDIQEFYLGFGHGGDTKSYRDAKQYRRKRRWHG